MNIRTSQQQNAATCCGCPRQACVPRYEEFGTCGWLAGDDDEFTTWGYDVYETDGAPDPEFAAIYGTVTVTKTATFDAGGEPGFGFDDYTQHNEAEYIRIFTRSVDDAGGCDNDDATGTATWTGGYAGTYDTPPGGDYLISYAYVGSGTLTPGSSDMTPGTGTETYTYAITGADTDPIGFVYMALTGTPTTAWTGSAWLATYDNGTVEIAYSGYKSVPYRFGIPSGYTRSVWEMEWDDVAASQDWWDWFDGGMIGTEPTPGPVLVEHRTWAWAGDPGEPWSPICDPAPQEAALIVRPVNVLVVCYHSTRLGVKPTAYGDQIAIE